MAMLSHSQQLKLIAEGLNISLKHKDASNLPEALRQQCDKQVQFYLGKLIELAGELNHGKT